MRTFRPNNRNYIYGLMGLSVMIVVLSFSLYVETGFMDFRRSLGMGVFWIFLILFSLVPFMFKIEVGKDFVKSYFLGILICEANSINLKSIQYKSFRIGFFGSIKVLRIKTKSNSFFKTISIGENLYGKEVINQVMEVLK